MTRGCFAINTEVPIHIIEITLAFAVCPSPEHR